MDITRNARSTRFGGAGIRLAVFAAAGTVGLAACGSSVPASSGTPVQATTTSTSALPKVTIAKAVNTEPFAAADVALKLGYFTQSGLDAKVVTLGGSSVANAALQSGSVQFVLASAASVLLATSRNVPLLVVGGINKGEGLQLVVANTWIKTHAISQSQPLAARIKELEGTTDATLSSSDKTVLKDFELQSHVPVSAIHSVSISSDSAMLAAVQHGLAQEFIASPPNSSIAVADGFAKVIASSNELPYASDEADDIVITTPAYAKTHPTVVTAVVKALGEALTQMSNQTPAGIAAIQSHYPTLSTAVVKSSLASFTFTPDMKQTQIGWNDALALARQTGLVKAGVNVNVQEGGIWTNQFAG